MTRIAFEEFDLHRVHAATTVDNVGSPRVLECNGFVRYGVAPPRSSSRGDGRTTPSINSSGLSNTMQRSGVSGSVTKPSSPGDCSVRLGNQIAAAWVQDG